MRTNPLFEIFFFKFLVSCFLEHGNRIETTETFLNFGKTMKATKYGSCSEFVSLAEQMGITDEEDENGDESSDSVENRIRACSTGSRPFRPRN